MFSLILQLLAEANLAGGVRAAVYEGLPNLPCSSFDELVRLNEIVQDPIIVMDRANKRCSKLLVTSNPRESVDDLGFKKRKRKMPSRCIEDDDDCDMIIDNSLDTTLTMIKQQ